ncbi:MAG: hypothetical protein BA871_12545 [Desulfuromonadales bacterium C00003096]|jgi:hypothetical protein|nr:MAG: hypothetical protein BA871_12545 [Desulfuromonadales bacterium C00003096]
MIFYGRYRENYGAHRPFIIAYILSPEGQWIQYSFLVDTGADETFLHYRSIKILGIDTSRLEIRDDVGGVGGYGIPYFRFNTQIKLISSSDTKVFGGTVNIFGSTGICVMPKPVNRNQCGE